VRRSHAYPWVIGPDSALLLRTVKGVARQCIAAITGRRKGFTADSQSGSAAPGDALRTYAEHGVSQLRRCGMVARATRAMTAAALVNPYSRLVS
jgi:hypothetical protein